jgi:transposase InsO family protein
VPDPASRYRIEWGEGGRGLGQGVALRGTPQSITVDNGTEFASKARDLWAYKNGVHLDFIRRGRPVENSYIESFNGKLRDECLNVEVFFTLADGFCILTESADEGDFVEHGVGLRFFWLCPLSAVHACPEGVLSSSSSRGEWTESVEGEPWTRRGDGSSDRVR